MSQSEAASSPGARVRWRRVLVYYLLVYAVTYG
jgi:hypothetical protein